MIHSLLDRFAAAELVHALVGLPLDTHTIDRYAKRRGYATLSLWTNDVLVEARRIYEGAGFTLARRAEHRSFGRDLVGEDWVLEL